MSSVNIAEMTPEIKAAIERAGQGEDVGYETEELVRMGLLTRASRIKGVELTAMGWDAYAEISDEG